jgi:hypothetical protein
MSRWRSRLERYGRARRRASAAHSALGTGYARTLCGPWAGGGRVLSADHAPQTPQAPSEDVSAATRPRRVFARPGAGACVAVRRRYSFASSVPAPGSCASALRRSVGATVVCPRVGEPTGAPGVASRAKQHSGSSLSGLPVLVRTSSDGTDDEAARRLLHPSRSATTDRQERTPASRGKQRATRPLSPGAGSPCLGRGAPAPDDRRGLSNACSRRRAGASVEPSCFDSVRPSRVPRVTWPWRRSAHQPM